MHVELPLMHAEPPLMHVELPLELASTKQGKGERGGGKRGGAQRRTSPWAAANLNISAALTSFLGTPVP